MATVPARVVLQVPYLQKEKAKALGAKWDAAAKVWWIPATMDASPFAAWIPASKERMVYQDLTPLGRDEFEPYGRPASVDVVFVPWECWKCHKTTVAFHGALNHGGLSVTHLLYQARALEELERLRKAMDMRPFGTVKPRFSRTVGASYVSQGCSYCDALIGEHPLWEDFCEMFSTTDLSTYPHRGTIAWSLLTADVR